MLAADGGAAPRSSSSSDRPSRTSSKISARAQATLDAMKGLDLNSSDPAGYPPQPPTRSAHLRRNSDASVTLGYPMNFDTPKGTGIDKGAQLAKAFGLVDNEAWEDFGRTKYDATRDDASSTKSGDTGTTGKLTRGQRDIRAASVWDMEATLREGKPVASGKFLFAPRILFASNIFLSLSVSSPARSQSPFGRRFPRPRRDRPSQT
jgi:hypothetical protein